MELKLSVKSKEEAERLVLVTAIGLLDSILRGALTIDESEFYLFTPYTVDILQRKNLDSAVIRIVELGCELEDIESLLPHILEFEVAKLKRDAINLLKNKKTLEMDDYQQGKKWFDY